MTERSAAVAGAGSRDRIAGADSLRLHRRVSTTILILIRLPFGWDGPSRRRRDEVVATTAHNVPPAPAHRGRQTRKIWAVPTVVHQGVPGRNVPGQKIGFLSSGPVVAPTPGAQTRTAADALQQSVELAVAAGELQGDGACFRRQIIRKPRESERLIGTGQGLLKVFSRWHLPC